MNGNNIKTPTRREQVTLKLMIVIGVFSMLFFLYGLTKPSLIANPVLYGMLLFTLLFSCFKVLYEWYHYLHITVPPTPQVEKVFTVDIFTTFCKGEPYEMIVETLTALQAITYPHNTYLCDEADDPYLKEVCKQLGVHHVTRVDKTNAKAGNINNALKHSKGELCVVLDPDHVPQPDFLDPIVSHFNNPEVGFVQVVQAYGNYRETLIAKGAAQQTFQFYGPMMMTMNKYGTVLAIGANCTFRRTALESIGGHAAGLAEDMHTAMQLHAKGWKSVYVPKVLARGLVPTNLIAYYKQQLKWSRGVFELLVTSYTDLFKKFTWRQKIHYALIPMYYLSGVVFLINFLIPIISLFTDLYPLRMDLELFFLLSAPLMVSTLIIRNFVQHWVMEDSERGFHVIGGLLLIGTWWVFNLGLIYTIIRKNVPYIPTPKDNKNQNSFLINLPNICVLLLSLIAIAYGLYNDWNPFTFMMVGIASVNCVFMAVSILMGLQLQFRKYKMRHQALINIHSRLSIAKAKFWLFRRRVYSFFRNGGLAVSIVTILLCGYVMLRTKQDNTIITHYVDYRQKMFLSGIFSPDDTDGQTSLKQVNAYQAALKTHFDIVSFYIPWGDQQNCFIAQAKVDSVFVNNSIPMITWEPWQKLFKNSNAGDLKFADEKVFLHITQGRFDDYIKKFALQLKGLNHPVFLRFAHETDNPAYPWSARGNNTPEEFKKAWIYIQNMFVQNKANNVIWVWNPWHADKFKRYFPGVDYVDWLGVTGLNYGKQHGTNNQSFRDLYAPFHKLFAAYDLPVMVAEMGSLKSAKNQDEWLKSSFKTITNSYKEIKGFVLFNSAVDKNLPDGSSGLLDWTINKNLQLSVPGLTSQRLYKPLALNVNNASATPLKSKNHNYLLNLKGVNYDNGQYWHNNTNPLTKPGIIEDFATMKAAGLNAIKLYGPNMYDRILFDVAEQSNMKINYSFWIPDRMDFQKDTIVLNNLKSDILKSVSKNKNNRQIIAWNIGNSVIQKLSSYYYKPDLLYQQDAYLNWLRQLIIAIKHIDPQRLVTVDVMVATTLNQYAALMHNRVPEIDSYGLVFPENAQGADQISKLDLPYYFSDAAAEFYLKQAPGNIGAFVGSWEDQHTASILTFNGLKDEYSRNKPQLYQLSRRWGGKVEKNYLPKIKILRPADATQYNSQLYYYALVDKDGKWQFADPLNKDLTFEWYLVKYDELGFAVYEKSLGKGFYKLVKIPRDVSSYKLYLVGSKGKNLTISKSILNIPL